ncbi:MAG: hypothetical protein P8K66_03085 [Planctomycetota bacterium]|nr:hypothetical protein [Planctomycetota bacterium]
MKVIPLFLGSWEPCAGLLRFVAVYLAQDEMTHRRRILGRIWRSLELSDLWAWQKWGNGKYESG